MSCSRLQGFATSWLANSLERTMTPLWWKPWHFVVTGFLQLRFCLKVIDYVFFQVLPSCLSCFTGSTYWVCVPHQKGVYDKVASTQLGWTLTRIHSTYHNAKAKKAPHSPRFQGRESDPAIARSLYTPVMYGLFASYLNGCYSPASLDPLTWPIYNQHWVWPLCCHSIILLMSWILIFTLLTMSKIWKSRCFRANKRTCVLAKVVHRLG